ACTISTHQVTQVRTGISQHQPGTTLHSTHTFPTRRSSDLAGPGAARPAARPDLQRGLERRAVGAAGRRLSAGDAGRGRPGAGDRSEEHTSELQSPCNLVCGLLFEKIKGSFYWR